MGVTSIEWTDFSINPIRARHKSTGAVGHYCEKISADCANCYASRMQSRFKMPPFTASHRDDVEPFFDDETLLEVLRRRKPARWFWCDMSDLFGAWVPDEWIDKCVAIMALTPWHTHQLLTKRADRMASYFAGGRESAAVFRICEFMGEFAQHQPKRVADLEAWLGKNYLLPLPNLWPGFSAENQSQVDARAPHLAPMMHEGWTVWCSAEPLLGPIIMQGFDGKFFRNWLGEGGIRWVVVGGESGHHARPMHPDWARGLRDQCQAAGVPFFFKQWGEFKPVSSASYATDMADGINRVAMLADGRLCFRDRGPAVRKDLVDSAAAADLHREYERREKMAAAGHYDPEWEHTHPLGYQWMARVGKQAAGRLLDGREWSEMPAAEAEMNAVSDPLERSADAIATDHGPTD